MTEYLGFLLIRLLLQDFKIADMGMNLLRVINTVGIYNADKLSVKCIRPFYHTAEKLDFIGSFSYFWL